MTDGTLNLRDQIGSVETRPAETPLSIPKERESVIRASKRMQFQMQSAPFEIIAAGGSLTLRAVWAGCESVHVSCKVIIPVKVPYNLRESVHISCKVIIPNTLVWVCKPLHTHTYHMHLQHSILDMRTRAHSHTHLALPDNF